LDLPCYLLIKKRRIRRLGKNPLMAARQQSLHVFCAQQSEGEKKRAGTRPALSGRPIRVD